jgi:hypothetical protein
MLKITLDHLVHTLSTVLKYDGAKLQSVEAQAIWMYLTYILSLLKVIKGI